MRWLPALASLCVTSAAPAAAPTITHYFDESTNRQAIVTDGDYGKVTLVFRFVGGPGSFGRWYGDGNRKDNDITFSQTVGEDQERGTVFVAKATDTKLEVAFKPKQRMPVDAGINGTYRHISEDKRTSLAKKESAASDDALVLALKTAPKTWPNEDRPTAADWKSRWPDLRKRWMSVYFKAAPAPAPAPLAASAGKSPVGATPPIGSKAGDSATPPSADYWTALSETTGMGIAFLNQPLDKAIPDTDGDYDDGFGGRVILRTGSDGTLRFTLTCVRGAGEGQSGELIGKIAPAQITKEKNGAFTATCTHNDAALKPEEKQATVKLHKSGHFLTVETQYADRYYGRAWFDGIYRWMPVPKE